MPSKLDYFVHQSSYVDDGCRIGAGTKIWHYCHIIAGAKIGERCVLGQNVNVGGQAVIGHDVKIQNNVSVYDGVTIEDGVFCGPSMVFTNDLNPRARWPKNGHRVPTLVRAGASIGANATIVCGVTIGRGSFIGSGSVVTKDIPDYAVAYGVPAKIAGWICECGTPLKFGGQATAACQSCHRKYRKENETVTQIKR